MNTRAQLQAEETFAISYRDVFEATKIIYGHILRTPTLPAPKLSELTGAEVFVKYENLQITGAFKDRGALVKMQSLTAEERARGVIAMSAGNHAQAVASRAKQLGIPATIVMPEGTPNVKVSNTEAFGAKVILAGQTLAEAQVRSRELCEENGLIFIHPYDDPHIMAGQGTIGMEMLEEQPDLDCVVIPIGGGGLIAGCSVAMKQLKPGIEIIGVETGLYPSMIAALEGETAHCGGQTLAEGIAVKNAGALAVPIVRSLVADILTVDETAIERAISAFLSLQKTMAEGAGAA
ncbi:MAG TPA: pyridoxal-phosphate dependent enzyme, partial [Hyphomicrobiales bacterium]|nr:pyridoxal-phosphate dependent enzyme [Hyphomicrobiales bacterium]